LQLSAAEISNLVVKDQYLSRKSGITHIYLIQTYNGIELYNAVLNINIGRDGSIINIGSRIVPGLTGALQETEPELSAVNALQKAAEHLNLELDQSPTVQQITGGPAQAVVMAGSGISRNPIPCPGNRIHYFHACHT
jgi:Zn-dependent metalloprotease